MKYQTILLKIIEEEIETFLTEQAAPPTAPATSIPTSPVDPAAPATPDASPMEDKSEDDTGEDKSKLEATLKSLAAKTPIDIKKTLLSSLQNGAKKADTETLVAYVQNKEEKVPSEEEDTKASVPENIKKAVKHIIKTFKFKVPEKAEKDAKKEEEKDNEVAEEETKASSATSTPSAVPVKESRLQTTLREYLTYKQLSQKVKKQ